MPQDHNPPGTTPENNTPNPSPEIKTEPAAETTETKPETETPENKEHVPTTETNTETSTEEKPPVNIKEIGEDFLSEEQSRYIEEFRTSAFDEPEKEDPTAKLYSEIEDLKNRIENKEEDVDDSDEYEDPSIRALKEKVEKLEREAEAKEEEKRQNALNQEVDRIESLNQAVLVKFRDNRLDKYYAHVGLDKLPKPQQNFIKRGISSEITDYLSTNEQKLGRLLTPKETKMACDNYWKYLVSQIDMTDPGAEKGVTNVDGTTVEHSVNISAELKELNTRKAEVARKVEAFTSLPRHEQISKREEVRQMQQELSEIAAKEKTLKQ